MSAKLLRDAARAIRDDAPSLDEDRAWHPAVALAVADWLEDAAKTIAWSERPGAGEVDPSWPALAVARAYLGSDS